MLSKLHCILVPISESLSLFLSSFYCWQEEEMEVLGVLGMGLPLPWFCPILEGRYLMGFSK